MRTDGADTDRKSIRKQLAADLPGKVSAPELASAALRRSDLRDQYAADFPGRLAAIRKSGRKRTVEDWISNAQKRAEVPLRTGTDIYLGLVLVSPALAKEIAGERPQSVAFERASATFTDRLSHAVKEQWDQGAASLPTPADRAHLPAMARVLEVGKAEFSTFSESHFYRQPVFEARPEARAAYRRFHIPVRRAFEARHGTILDEYWCTQVPVGVVRTTGGKKRGSSRVRVHFDGDYDECLVEIFNRCKEVNRKGLRFLPREEYKTLAGNLYDLFTDLLSAVDDAVEDVKPRNREKAIKRIGLKRFLRRIEKLEKTELDPGSRRQGQRWYIAGTVLGLFLIGGAFAGAAIAVGGHWQQIFEGATFGAAGALASVSFRMSRGKLDVDAQQGRTLVVLSAMLKPLTGAIFGGIVVALLLGGLAQISIPDADPKRFYFLAVFAFIAGFSERWAPNLLQLTEERVKGDHAQPAK